MRRSRFVLGITLFGVLLLDQGLKAMALKGLPANERLPGKVLGLTLVKNRGAAFGLFQEHQVLLIIFTAIILVLAAFFLLKGSRWLSGVQRTSVTLMIGGGLSNLLDRVLRGFVVDYIEIRIFRFAVFNFADICICLGAVILVWDILSSGRKVELNGCG